MDAYQPKIDAVTAALFISLAVILFYFNSTADSRDLNEEFHSIVRRQRNDIILVPDWLNTMGPRPPLSGNQIEEEYHLHSR